MRRNHSIDNIPFAENLVFYAPLTEGDLTDHVSRTSMVDGNRGTYIWDSEKKMYLFSFTNSSSGTVGYWDVNLRMSTIETQSYTLFCKIICDDVSSGRPYVFGLGNFDMSNSYKPSVCAGHYYGRNSNQKIESISYIAAVRDGLQGKLYYYPCVNNQWDESSTGTHMSNPENWNNINLCGSRVCVCIRRDNFAPKFWIKDARVYNRALSAQDLAQL